MKKEIHVKQVTETEDFITSLDKLRDRRARAKILARIKRIKDDGHIGDSKPLEGGLKELLFIEGKGYRVYYAENDEIIFILCMGHKGTQSRDIRKARRLAEEGNEQWYLKQGLLIQRTI